MTHPPRPLPRLHKVLPSASPGAMRPPAPAPLVPAVARAMALLDRLAQQRQPMTMARLAADLALPKSSVHGLCTTLLALGYLQRQGDGSVALGARVLDLAEAFVAGIDVAREFDALWNTAVPPQAPDETVLLSVLDGGEVVYLSARNGTRPLSMAFARGMRLPAHLAATGRAMLAFHDVATAQRQLGSAPLLALTPRSVVEPAALAAELAATRARGYSIDDEGVRLGVYSLAAPVLDAGGRPVAGVGVSLHKATLDAADLARQQQRVVDTARTLSQRLGGCAAAALSSTLSRATDA